MDKPIVEEEFKWTDHLFSTLTIEESKKLFEEYCENSLDQFEETKDKLSLLRSCIELLNRLEDSTHSLFAGRVLLFLARVVPLFDQSGLNLRSDISVRELPTKVLESLEQIGARNGPKDKHSSGLIGEDIEEGETLSDDGSNDSIPHEDADKIYERFWRIQQLLSQPNILYDRSTWFTFRTHLDTLLYRLEEKPATVRVWDLSKSYMTTPGSLALQMSDVNLRRCFLVQILIVLQYMELPVEAKPDNFVPDKVHLTWSSTVRIRVYKMLDMNPNRAEGKKFSTIVQNILRREEMWNKWKNDKCKEPKKPEQEFVNMRGTHHKRRKVSDELSTAKAYGLHVIGSQEMSRLWNMKTSSKFQTPDIVKHLTLPAEKQAESFKDPNFSFRLLRLLRRSPHFFGPSTAVIQSLDGYLKAAATRYSISAKTQEPTTEANESVQRAE